MWNDWRDFKLRVVYLSQACKSLELHREILHIKDSKREAKLLQQRRLKCDHVFTICLKKNKWYDYNETVRSPELFLHALDPTQKRFQDSFILIALVSYPFFSRSVSSRKFLHWSWGTKPDPRIIHNLKKMEMTLNRYSRKAHEASRFHAKSWSLWL